MKKILLSSTVLLFFALSITIFQLSCQKDAEAENPLYESFTPLKKIIYSKFKVVSNSVVLEIWICNYDGTDNTRLNLSLPNGVVILESNFFLSTDGEKIFFKAGPDNGSGIPEYFEMYSCNINGSDVTKIVSGSTTSSITICDVK